MLTVAAPKDVVGIYLLASSFLAIVLTVTFSAFDQGLLRNVADYHERGQLARRYSAMLFAYVGIAVFLSCIAGLTSAFYQLPATLSPLLLPMSAWLVFESIKNLSQTIASGMRYRALIAVCSAADYGCRIVFLLWLSMNATLDAKLIVGLLAAAGVVASASYFIGQRSMLARFSWADVSATLHDAFGFSWPMIIWGIFGWLQNMSNRWMLSRFADLPSVAEYGVLVSIASFPVTALLGLVVTYIVPIIYQREGSHAGSSRRTVVRVAFLMLPVFILMVLVSSFLHKDIVATLSGPQYTNHSNLLPIILIAACFSATCSVLTYAVYAQRRVSLLLVANTVPGAFSLVFGYFVIQSSQFEGAVLTLVLSHCIAGFLFIATFFYSQLKSAANV
jgi:O-antigen/teichoic acid export membrane protein